MAYSTRTRRPVSDGVKSPIRRAKDLTGQIFGALRVIEWAGTATVPSKSGGRPSQISQWLCRCDCGQSLIVKSYNLTRGRTTSCGCIRAMAAEGCAIFLVHRDDNWKIIHAWAGVAGRDGIKPLTFYTLDASGQPVEGVAP